MATLDKCQKFCDDIVPGIGKGRTAEDSRAHLLEMHAALTTHFFPSREWNMESAFLEYYIGPAESVPEPNAQPGDVFQHLRVRFPSLMTHGHSLSEDLPRLNAIGLHMVHTAWAIHEGMSMAGAAKGYTHPINEHLVPWIVEPGIDRSFTNDRGLVEIAQKTAKGIHVTMNRQMLRQTRISLKTYIGSPNTEVIIFHQKHDKTRQPVAFVGGMVIPPDPDASRPPNRRVIAHHVLPGLLAEETHLTRYRIGTIGFTSTERYYDMSTILSHLLRIHQHEALQLDLLK